MSEKSVKYSDSRNKRIVFLVVWLLLLFCIGIVMEPIDTGIKQIIALFLIVLISVFIWFELKKSAKEASCPYCDAELFILIERSKMEKIDFKFCPACGNSIDV